MSSSIPVLAPLMLATEVAEILNVSRWTVDRLRRRGDLVSVGVADGLYRFDPADVAAYIRARRG